jgi:hypothetical protein
VCVFGIFFVSNMMSLVRELWRMVAPGGMLAVTTWGPRIFSPAYEVWNEEVRRIRPDLYAAFNPWDRITTPEARSGRRSACEGRRRGPARRSGPRGDKRYLRRCTAGGLNRKTLRPAI